MTASERVDSGSKVVNLGCLGLDVDVDVEVEASDWGLGSRYHALAFAFSNSSFLPTDVLEKARVDNGRRARLLAEGDESLRRHDRHNDMLSVLMVKIKIKLIESISRGVSIL